MELICPSRHAIYLNLDSMSHCDTLSGTTYLSEPTELSSLHVSLIQATLVNPEPHPTSNHKQKRRLSKKLFKFPNSKQEPQKLDQKKSSFVTEILRCNISTSSISNQVRQQGNAAQVFGFTLCIPQDIPETVKTPSIALSYELVASATTTNGHQRTARQTLYISRLKIPSPREVYTYIRTFPETKIRAEFILCPQLSPSNVQCSDRHVSAQLLLRDVVTPGPRHAELSMVVVKELAWRVEEIEKWDLRQAETGPVRRERTIAMNGLKGRWPATITSGENARAADMKIVIPFGITIDGSANALNDFDVCGSDQSQATSSLTVKHRLTISIVTGSETVNRETGSLVDKRDTVRILGATVPIPVHEYAEESAASRRSSILNGMLPHYDGTSGGPPTYRDACRKMTMCSTDVVQ